MLLSPTTCTPGWVVKGSLSRFIQLRAKLKELMYAKNEMDKSIQSKNPDDNQFMVAYKQAGKQAGAELGQAQLWLGSRYRQATIAEV